MSLSRLNTGIIFTSFRILVMRTTTGLNADIAQLAELRSVKGYTTEFPWSQVRVLLSAPFPLKRFDILFGMKPCNWKHVGTVE